MFDVRSVIEPVQIAQQAKPADRPPADKFDETIGGISLRGYKHRATGILAVVESEEKRAPLVPLRIPIASQGKRAPAQLHDAYENTEQVTQVSKGLEHTIGQSRNIRGETNA